ncbi:MAG: YIP1 family protein [bacterium]
MFDVYTAPTRAFARLKEKPSWLLPVALVLVFNIAATFVTTQYVDWTAQRDLAVEQMQKRGMTQEQIDQAGMEKFYGSPVARFGLPLVGALVTGIIGILLLTLIYNVSLPMLGASSNFVRSLSVVAWAGMALIPGAIIRIVLVLLKKSADVTTSLLLLAPNLKGGFVAALLAQVDPFAIWQLILAGLGLKVVFDLKGARSYILVFAVWVMLTLIFSLLGARGAVRA